MASRELQIELLPGRKRKALVLIDGGRLIPLAYFVKDEYVKLFTDMNVRYNPPEN